MNRINLFEETLTELASHDKKPGDVRWVGGKDFYFTWEEFCELANYIFYNSLYGIQEIASDLVIVGEDWWMERAESEGSEWWEFKTMPLRPERKVMPGALAERQASDAKMVGGRTLTEMNRRKVPRRNE